MNFNLVEMYNGLLRFNNTMIDYLEYCALQALCYIEYANFDNQAALNTNLTSDGFKQGGLGAGVGFFTTVKLD